MGKGGNKWWLVKRPSIIDFKAAHLESEKHPTPFVMKRLITKAIAIYLGIYALSLGAFWLLPTIDALGYSLFFLWLIQPLVIFTISLHIMRIERKVHFAGTLPLFFGIAFCLLPYLTFDLANTLHFGTLHAPSIGSFIVGALISGAGSALGLLLANERSRS